MILRENSGIKIKWFEKEQKKEQDNLKWNHMVNLLNQNHRKKILTDLDLVNPAKRIQEKSIVMSLIKNTVCQLKCNLVKNSCKMHYWILTSNKEKHLNLQVLNKLKTVPIHRTAALSQDKIPKKRKKKKLLLKRNMMKIEKEYEKIENNSWRKRQGRQLEHKKHLSKLLNQQNGAKIKDQNHESLLDHPKKLNKNSQKFKNHKHIKSASCKTINSDWISKTNKSSTITSIN